MLKKEFELPEGFIEIKDFIYDCVQEEYKNYKISSIINRIESIKNYKKGKIKIQRLRNGRENIIYCIKENEKIDFLKMLRYTNCVVFYSDLSSVIKKAEQKTNEQEYINFEQIIKKHISKEYHKGRTVMIKTIKIILEDTVCENKKFEIYSFKNDLGVTEYFVKKEDYEKVINFIKNTSSKIFDYKKDKIVIDFNKTEEENLKELQKLTSDFEFLSKNKHKNFIVEYYQKKETNIEKEYEDLGYIDIFFSGFNVTLQLETGLDEVVKNDFISGLFNEEIEVIYTKKDETIKFIEDLNLDYNNLGKEKIVEILKNYEQKLANDVKQNFENICSELTNK